jgi:ABC-type cobalt transport system substrate-binding protein
MAIQQNFPDEGPSLNLNFAGSRTLDPRITFTRTSSATYTGPDGLIKIAPVNSPRFDHRYNPTTGEIESLGLLVEEQRTNSIRNNTMVGAVAGTPGTAPTSWSVSSTGNDITREIVGTGTENGITYIDIKYSGTPTVGNNVQINFETVNAISASSGQSWSISAYIALIAGSLSGTSMTFSMLETDGSTGVSDKAKSISPSAGSLAVKREVHSVALTGATTTHIQPRIRVGYTIGTPIDITLRIGLPQLELGAFPTSVIPTTASTVTRTADNVSMRGENFSSWYNSSEGSIFTAFRCDNWNSSNQFGKVFTINQATFGVENNEFWIGNDADNSNTVRYRVRSGGVNQFGPANLTRTSTIVTSPNSHTTQKDFLTPFFKISQNKTNGNSTKLSID